MNVTRIGLAAVAAFVAYMAVGALAFAALPVLKKEFQQYPAVYRPHEGQMKHFPLGMLGMLLCMVVLTVLYAKLCKDGSGLAEGAGFGALIGLFVVGGFVLHNHANLNIGAKLTAYSAIAYFLEWCVVGIVIGLVY